MAESSWYDRADAAVGGILPGGVAVGTSSEELAQGPNPFAAVAPRAASVRKAGGRTMTSTATVYPDGSVVPRSMTPGGVALYRRDLTAYNKVVKIARKISPARRTRKGKLKRKR